MTSHVLGTTAGGGTVTAYEESAIETADRLERELAHTDVRLTSGQVRLLEEVQREVTHR